MKSKKSDYELAHTILDLRDGYGFQYEDADAFRMGKKHFDDFGKKMKSAVAEAFNRVAKNGPKAHPSLKPVVEALEGLSAKERKDTEKVYRSLRGLDHKDISKP